MDRDALVERIEAASARCSPAGPSRRSSARSRCGASRTARKALGFKEIAAHLAGEADLDETRARIERGHIAYVKRQLTWMRKLAGVQMIDRTAMRPVDVGRSRGSP